MTLQRRYRVHPKLWFCLECARLGRLNVYVSTRETTCPFGHRRKGLKK